MPKFRFKTVLPMLALLAFVLLPDLAFAQTAAAGDAGQAADNLSRQFNSFGHLALVACFCAGIGVAGAAAFKFKAHSENAQQVPIKVPIFYAIVAAILIAIPTFMAIGRNSIFGTSQGSPQIETIGNF